MTHTVTTWHGIVLHDFAVMGPLFIIVSVVVAVLAVWYVRISTANGNAQNG